MLLRYLFLGACTLRLVGATHAQGDTLATHYAKGISEAELRTHLEVLASDAYMGRDTGKEGQKMAAAYLKKHFASMGIPPVPANYAENIVDGYFQPYELIEERTGGLTLEHHGQTLELLKGLLYFNEVLKSDLAVKELTYLGDASRSLDGLDLSGKAVLIDASKMDVGETMFRALRTRMEPVRKAGAAVILVSMPQFGGLVDMVHTDGGRLKLAYEAKKENGNPAGQLLLLEDATTKEILGTSVFKKLRRKKPGFKLAVDIALKAKNMEARVVAENVLAYIEGSDKKDEVVILTAHYDHIGVEKGVVYNGADDDGSGTVALLEIAEAFAQAKADGHGPRRSVLVMPVSGEEKGLLGSHFYSDHPVFPIANTVADLNIDMIGRVDSAHATSAPYVYVIGSDRLSTGLHAANEEANKQVGLLLDYTFNEESDPNRFYYRSDHYNFARKGIPSVFYFSGVHEDYHEPGDDVEKIHFDLLRTRALLVFYTAWSLANGEERIVVDKPSK